MANPKSPKPAGPSFADRAVKVEGAESLKAGESVEGYYCGHTIIVLAPSPKNKHGGPCHKHTFLLPSGATRSVLGATMMNSRLENVGLGARVYVERTGDKFGTTNADDYIVMVDPDEPLHTECIIGRQKHVETEGSAT